MNEENKRHAAQGSDRMEKRTQMELGKIENMVRQRMMAWKKEMKEKEKSKINGSFCEKRF